MANLFIIDTNFGNCFLNIGFKGERMEQVGIFASTRAEFFMDDYVGYAGGKAID